MSYKEFYEKRKEIYADYEGHNLSSKLFKWFYAQKLDPTIKRAVEKMQKESVRLQNIIHNTKMDKLREKYNIK